MSVITKLTPDTADRAGSATDAGPHVLLVLDQFPKTLGGGERAALRLAALLPRYGYRVSILTFSVHPECDVVRTSPCPLYLLPLRRTYDLAALRGALSLRRFLKQQQIQIVQTFFESSDIWAGTVTRALSSAKLIWSRRDLGILRTGKHHRAYRLMASFPHAVFAVSEQVRRHSIEVDGIDPARVQTIYNGLDLEDWTAPAARERTATVHVTAVGNIRHVKGHDIFIQAAAAVVSRFPDVSFSIAGDVLEPEYFARLEALVRDLGLVGRFHFIGGVADLPAYLASADIFVMPSRSEGFSNAIVEAMAMSLPVVATGVGGNAEAVKDGVNGFVVPPEDPEALAAAISQLIANRTQAKIMGEEGRNIVVETFTSEAMMEKIVATYRRLLAARAAQARPDGMTSSISSF